MIPLTHNTHMTADYAGLVQALQSKLGFLTLGNLPLISDKIVIQMFSTLSTGEGFQGSKPQN